MPIGNLCSFFFSCCKQSNNLLLSFLIHKKAQTSRQHYQIQLVIVGIGNCIICGCNKYICSSEKNPCHSIFGHISLISQTPRNKEKDCTACKHTKQEKKKLQRQLRALQVKIEKQEVEKKVNQEKWAEAFSNLHNPKSVVSTGELFLQPFFAFYECKLVYGHCTQFQND